MTPMYTVTRNAAVNCIDYECTVYWFDYILPIKNIPRIIKNI